MRIIDFCFVALFYWGAEVFVMRSTRMRETWVCERGMDYGSIKLEQY